MKSKFADFYVFFLLILVIMLDIAGYFVCHDPNAHPNRTFLWAFCSFMTLGVVMINFIYFNVFTVSEK